MGKYYIIKTDYVGPNQDQNIDADTIEISTEPARKNMSGEICLSGWCGTTNDWVVYAHGVYDSEDEARAAINAEFGAVREGNENEDFWSFNPASVAVFKPGEYTPFNRSETENWIYESMHNDITAKTTDDEIKTIAADYEDSANDGGYTLTDAEEIMENYRDALINEE